MTSLTFCATQLSSCFNIPATVKMLKKLPQTNWHDLMITHQLSLADSSDCVYGMLMGKLVDNTTEATRLSSLQSDEEDSLCCPSCDKEIDLQKIRYQSKVLLDQCPKCKGVWLDEGELELLSKLV